MSYALALGLDQSIVNQLKALSPKCWSADLDQCYNEFDTSYPNCNEILKIGKAHPDELEEWQSDTPWCPETLEKNYTVLPPGYKGLAIAGGAGALLGLLFGYFAFG